MAVLPVSEDSPDRKVAALSVPATKGGTRQLRIINLTTFAEEYTLSLPRHSLLMQTTDPER
jgi:hypothetical protein